MSREALIERRDFTTNARPAAIGHEPVHHAAFPGPRQMDLPFRVHAAYAGALLVFLVAVSAIGMGSEDMPLVFGVCVVFYLMYFGIMNLLASIETGEPKQRDTYAGSGIETASGHLTARQASAQVLTLPFLIAGFGIFALIAAKVIF